MAITIITMAAQSVPCTCSPSSSAPLATPSTGISITLIELASGGSVRAR